MQLRKRSSHVNYMEKGSPARARRVSGNSSDSEEEMSSGDTREGSTGLEVSDDTVEVVSVKKSPAKRKLGAGKDVGKVNNVLVYMKRNAGNSDLGTSSHGTQEEEDGDDDFEEVKPRKKRNFRAEPRTRALRSRKSDRVNYKDVSSSDEDEQEAPNGGGIDRGYSKKSARGRDRSSSELIVDDEEELPGSSAKQSNRKKGATYGKIRRIGPPLGESTDSARSHGKEGFRCYSRRYKNVISSDDEEDDRVAEASAPAEKIYNERNHGAPSRPNGKSSEQEDEEKSKTTTSKQSEIFNKGSNDGLYSAFVDQQHSKASVAKLGTEKPLTSKPSFTVDMYGLRLRIANDYAPLTKRISRVEKILAVRDRSIGTPIFCVKLYGHSYRTVVNVLEEQLQNECPQQLRTFVKRMHALGRMDGHPGDHEKAPCFNPQYLKIDRIVTAEKNKRATKYFVKWVGLPYSEATWERDEDLSGDLDAIKRFNCFNRKKKKTYVASSSSKLVFKDGRTLRDYQEEGVSWMDDKWQNGINCILADEMGLGKTIQSVAMLETLRLKRGIRGPFLVVAPVSTLGHWQREIETLTDMNCVVYSGNSEDREIMRGYEFKYEDGSRSSGMKFNVLLTSFEMVMKDQTKLVKISWKFIIVDEAHRLKSRESKTTLSLKQMGVPRGGLLLLTGTPVQNSTKEIFSLLNLLDSEKFGSEEDFLMKYGDLKNGEQVKDLQENVLRPRLLRRMKEDVEKSIPLKEETIVWVELTREQRTYYRAIYENSIGVLLKGSQCQNLPSLRNVAMELRKVCNHPLLCDGIEEDLTLKYCGPKPQKSSTSEPPLTLKLLQQSSGKMVFVDKLLPMLKEAGNRVLVFSQFTMMLDLLEDYLNFKGYSYERIDGKIRGCDRQAAIDRYSAKESDIFVFLLSTRAGGLGITLTAADTCLIYDSDWNPQNDLQAMARCHRIGQTKDVRIYRLITRNTYEQKLFEVSSRKYGLDEAILGNRVGADVDVEQTVSIESLLKHGAYDMVKEDGDAAAAEFNNQNIHEILEQRTQKRLIGGRGVNTFSVATFISQTDMDTDPNADRTQHLGKGSEEFWQELLPEAYKSSKTVVQKVSLSPLGSRRKRAQLKVDYREDPKSVSDDDFEVVEGSGRDSTSDESSVSTQFDDEVLMNSWSEKEVKRLEDRLMVLGRNRSSQIQHEANLAHYDLSEIDRVSDFLFQFCYFIEVNKPIQIPTTSQKSPTAQVEVNTSIQVTTTSQNSPNSQVVDQKPGGYAGGQRLDVNIAAGKPEVHSVLSTTDVHGVIQRPELLENLQSAADQLSGFKRIEPEGVAEILPLGCILVNEPETGVNYRKDGCLLIGEKRRPTPPACIRKAMKSKMLVDRLSKNASRYLQILREREILALAIARKDPLYLPPKVPVRSKKIPSWWGIKEDLDLMIGVDKHGHREFKKVRTDPSLCFAKRMFATNQADGLMIAPSQTDGHVINTMESQGSGLVAPCTPNPCPDEGLQGQDWPHESVLTARLKKLISLLPDGSGARETNKVTPKSHKKRVPDTSRNAEKTSPVVAREDPGKDASGVTGKDPLARAMGKDVSAGRTVKNLPTGSAVKDVQAGVSVKNLSPGAVGKGVSLGGVAKIQSPQAAGKNVSAGITVKKLSPHIAGNSAAAGITVKSLSPQVAGKNVVAGVTVKIPAKGAAAIGVSPGVIVKGPSTPAAGNYLSGVLLKNVPAGITLKDVSNETLPKVKANVEVLHSKPETINSGKEIEIPSRKPLLINSDKKEGGLENGRQQRITGYFIPKVAVAT